MELGSMELTGAVPADKVAKAAVKAMRKGRREVIPGWMNKGLPMLVRMTPVRMQLPVVSWLMS